MMLQYFTVKFIFIHELSLSFQNASDNRHVFPLSRVVTLVKAASFVCCLHGGIGVGDVGRYKLNGRDSITGEFSVFTSALSFRPISGLTKLYI